MNTGRYVLTQVLDYIHWQTLNRLAAHYNIRARHFGCRQQLICMGFAQLTWRESLRDIEECLNAKGPATLYKNRWQIELYFRWIKQHLRIKHFFGTSPNAVKTQVWIAVTVYVLIAILHKELKLPGSLHRTLQILSVHPFEKIPLHELLTETQNKTIVTDNPNQLWLW